MRSASRRASPPWWSPSSRWGRRLAGEAVQLGLRLGELVRAFDVDDVTGPNKGKTLCYR